MNRFVVLKYDGTKTNELLIAIFSMQRKLRKLLVFKSTKQEYLENVQNFSKRIFHSSL